jgi:hypothetical protein
LLQQLENNESVLLMYLADELPPDDRAEVEQLLARDANLRAEFDRLREAHDRFLADMRGLDRATRLSVPESTGVRRVALAMRRWQAEREARPPVQRSRPELRYPWWAYPAAAAASVVIAFLVWWGNSDRAVRVVYHPPVIDTAYDGPPLPRYDAEDVAAWWGINPSAEGSAEGTGAETADAAGGTDEDLATFALIDPSDFNVLMLPDEPDGSGFDEEDEFDVQ